MFFLLLALSAFGATDDAEVRKLLDNRISVAKKATGIVVDHRRESQSGDRAWATRNGWRHGLRNWIDTKAFTGILLAPTWRSLAR